MNNNYAYWEDRFLDVLRHFDPALVGEIIGPILQHCSNGGMVAPVLRLAVNLDRPDLMAPLLPDRGDGPSLEDVTWENEELVRLMLRRDARDRFGDKPLIDFVRGMDNPGVLQIEEYTLRDLYYGYQYVPSLLPVVVGRCPSQDEVVKDGQTIWLDILEALLETGVIASGTSGLIWHIAFERAVSGGYLEAVKLFLKHGASPNLRVGSSYIIMSALKRPEIYHALKAAGGKLAWNDVGVFNDLALDMAIWEQAISPMRDMLADAMESGNLATDRLNKFLGEATKGPSMEIVQLILDVGANIDTAFSGRFFDTNTNQQGNKEEFGNIEMLRFLLESGASMGAAMFEAARWNNRQALIWLIDRGGDIDTPNRDGKTTLMAAASLYEMHVEMLDFVLEQGPDINHISRDGSTALSLLIERAGFVRQYDGEEDPEVISAQIVAVVKRLLDAGADPNGSSRMMPLIIAAAVNCLEAVPLLLKAGANVNAVLEDGDMAWRIAERRGHKGIAKMLEEAGACEPDLSRTDLRAAILWGHADDALRLIEEGADIEQTDTCVRTPLLAALMEGGDTVIVERLLKKGANPSYSIFHPEWDENISPLLQAIELKRPDLVRILLAYGAHAGDVNGAWRALWGVAMWNAADDDRPRPVQANSMDIVRHLLEAGVPPGERNTEQGFTILQDVASANNVDLMKLLAEYGVDIDVRSKADNRVGYTALHDACSHLDVEGVEYLLECGANPNTVSVYGTFPLYDACHTPGWKQLNRLSDWSSFEETTQLEDDERACRIVKLLLDHGADVHIAQNHGQRCILRNARSVYELTEPRCEMIRLLLDAGAVD